VAIGDVRSCARDISMRIPPTARSARHRTSSAADRNCGCSNIGAGAAGIAAARAVSPRHSVVVLEARNRIGGRAFTYRKGNLALDLGCGWLHSADENEWGALAPTLGFKVDDMPPPWERPAHRVNFSTGEREDYHQDRADTIDASARVPSEQIVV